MSNHLAIATVTAAFSRMIGAAAQIGVGNATIRLGSPDVKTGTDNKPLVNLFLYQISPNAQQRNAHMPSRKSDGATLNTSRVALDLRYVLSFYGDAQKLEPERMAGAVAAAVEDRPLFTRDAIKKAIADTNSILQESDLEHALSTVRILPETHTLEELSRMWSIFFQVPYALSVSYLCSHVSIELGDQGRTLLPVTVPRIIAVPAAELRIDEVVSADGLTHPIVWGGTLLIRGRGLNAADLVVKIDGDDVSLAPGAVTADTITVTLETAQIGNELAAGYHKVQVVLPVPGAPAHLARTSETKLFALRPVITVTDLGLDPDPPVGMANGTLRIGFVPAVVEDQHVVLMLDERKPDGPENATLSPEAPQNFPVSELEFTYSELKLAKYLVCAQVDGVASAFQIDSTPGSATFGEILGPEADLT